MKNNFELSCEVFPPKEEDFINKTLKLKEELKPLRDMGINLISVTYGAGGSNRKMSLDLVKSLMEDGYNVMPHFTCVCSSMNYVKSYIEEIKKLGIKNILALRGDEPIDIDVCYLDFKYAYELVDYLKKNTDFNISVAGYPEKHPRAKTIDDDILNLKKKIDAGANKVYTQLFFNNENFYKYVDLCEKYKVNTAIIPGIMPITNFKNLKRMTEMCHALIPQKLYDELEKYQEDSEAIKKIGIEYASNQCHDLIKNNIKGLHFYTLNKAESTLKILKNIK